MQIGLWIIIILLGFAISEIACIDCEELAKNNNFNMDKYTLKNIYVCCKVIILVILCSIAIWGIKLVS